jgi:hypothetical protein
VILYISLLHAVREYSASKVTTTTTIDWSDNATGMNREGPCAIEEPEEDYSASMIVKNHLQIIKGANPEYVLSNRFFFYVGIYTKSLKRGIFQVKSSKRGYSEVFPNY